MKTKRPENIRICLCCLLTMAMMAGCASLEKRREQAQKVRQLGEAYLLEGSLSLAYTQFEKSREMNPRDPHIYYDLGLFFYRKDKYDRAAENFQKAIELKPDFATAINNLGVVYIAQKKWDQAIETLRPITENFAYATPQYPHFLLGQAFFHKKDCEAAIHHLQETISLQPGHLFAHYWLGKVYLACGETGAAIDTLEKAVEQVPQAAAFHLKLGRAYLQAERFARAEQAFAQAAALATNDNLEKEALQLQQMARNRQ